MIKEGDSCFLSLGNGKNAQFFILAAVIISSVIVSLGATMNAVSVNKEPGSFYDLSYEAKRESGAVIDYGVYSSDEKLDEFVEEYAQELKEKDPDTNVVFIYGDSDSLSVKNYGTDDSVVESEQGDSVVEGGSASVSNKLVFTFGNVQSSTNVEQEESDYNDNSESSFENVDNVDVNVGGGKYNFKLTKGTRKFYVVMQKESEGEKYVSVR